MIKILVVIVFLLCISLSVSEPICYQQICPAGTTNCKRNVRSSHNRKNLEIRINCLDDFDGSLKEYFFQEPSTMNPHIHYESSSYSAAGGNFHGGNKDVEDFAR